MKISYTLNLLAIAALIGVLAMSNLATQALAQETSSNQLAERDSSGCRR